MILVQTYTEYNYQPRTMMKRKLYLLALLGALVLGAVQAQDPVFSQFYAAPLMLNPAFAGTTLAPRFTFNHRNQYPSWPNAYITYAAAFEQEIAAINSGFGIQVITDAAGDGVFKNNYVSGVYSYHVRWNQHTHIRIGLEAGMSQTRLDWNRLLFEDQLDPITGPVDGGGNPIFSEENQPETLTTTLFDASAGLLLHHKNVYAGLSLKHLNRPNESFLKINENLFAGRPMRITLHAGAEFDLNGGNNSNSGTFISPNVMFVKQGDTGQIMAGAYVGYGKVFGGAWFRHNFTLADAGIFSVGVRQGVFRLAYSYDLTLSTLAAVPGGTGNTHEIAVVINLEDSESLKRKQHAARWNNCFKMFQ